MRVSFGSCFPLALASLASAETLPSPSPSLSVSAVDSQPKRRDLPSTEELEQLRRATLETPRLREPNSALTRALLATGDLAAAHEEAAAWREHDATIW